MARKHEIIYYTPDIGYNNELLYQQISSRYSVHQDRIRVLKRSLDARSHELKVRIEFEILAQSEDLGLYEHPIAYQKANPSKKVIIIGSGPAGLFAALRLLEEGFYPIILERGKKVQDRRRDLAAINKQNMVNPDSNYCFGEGGAGTYSDGKLYTRATKRGNVKRILEILVRHGAKPEILFDAHPHIGTNKLPKLIETIRQTILDHGGEIHFNQRVIDFELKNNQIQSVTTHTGNSYTGLAYLLATGHSARDIYYLLDSKGIHIEAKPFAMGVRIEHPQEIIDKSQYHGLERNIYLPAASYSLATQVKFNGVERGVFSFCMCPGGFIVPSATQQNELVVNGMSPSKRDSFFANSGMVVSILEEDFKGKDALAGLRLQEQFEATVWNAGGNTQTAPAQRLLDFLAGKVSSSLPITSYQPGLASVNMAEVLPKTIAYRLQEGFKNFGTKIKGFLTQEAQIIGAESRTSSPVRIPRDKTTYQHTQISNLYPCGEGAGYAGGIVSAAMDGENCAQAIITSNTK